MLHLYPFNKKIQFPDEPSFSQDGKNPINSKIPVEVASGPFISDPGAPCDHLFKLPWIFRKNDYSFILQFWV